LGAHTDDESLFAAGDPPGLNPAGFTTPYWLFSELLEDSSLVLTGGRFTKSGKRLGILPCLDML